MMTAQQQLDAFLADCTQIRAGYFFSFKKKSSSLRHFITRLETQIKTTAVKALTQQDFDLTITELKDSSPKDHVKYVAAVKNLIAVWGSNRDYVAFDFNQPVVLYWNNVKQELGATKRRIAVASRFSGYHAMVASHLTAISHCVAGRSLLTAIAAGGHDVTIVDHALMNQCTTHGSPSGMNLVAKELYPTTTDTLGPETLAAYNRAAVGGTARARWLADKINATPRYQLKGYPATAPCNLGVTPEQVSAWVGGRGINKDYNDADSAQIKNAVILALYSTSKAGPGCGSMVNYTLGTVNPLNAERPPAIGLAHELVHAYYNLQGVQPGYEVENPTTVLFEYRCVGLGPWETEPVSENAIRNAWDGILLHFDAEDDRNRKHITEREYYSAP
jgi:hypothetical protein